MDAIALLEQQHRDLDALFETVRSEERPAFRTRAMVNLVCGIEAHLRVEEVFLYPACADRMDGDRERLYEAVEVNALLVMGAGKLLRTRATDVRCAAKVKLLRELFARHVSEEDAWLFESAKRTLTDEQLEDIGRSIERSHALLLDLKLPSAEKVSQDSVAPHA